MAEHQVFVREAGEVEYDIMFVSETVQGRPLTLDDLHALIKETAARNEEIVKITLDDIAIRNANGLRFMFKKADPKLEVTWASTGSKRAAAAAAGSTSLAGGGAAAASALQGYPSPGAAYSAYAPSSSSSASAAVSAASSAGGPTSWIVQLEANPYSFGHAAVTINEHLFIFGGFADELTTNHCLLLSDTRKGKFQQLKTRGEGPTPRERASATVVGRNIFIFGGYNRGLEAYYNDLFIFESESLSWRKVEPRGQLPEARCGHTAAAIDDKIWIFGGRVKVKKGNSLFSGSGVAYTNDLYCYDPVINEWRRYEARGIGPSGRAMHTATAVGRKIYFFGGANSSGTRRDTSAFCDLYELDVDTMTWSECEVKGTPPTPCYGHSATYVGNNKILFFGGKAYNVLNTVTLLDLVKMEWKQYAYAGAPLQQRWGHSATLHDTRVLLYGGRNDAGYHNSYDIIDTTTQLIDIPPEELERDKQKKKLEERIKNQQMMGDLQRDVEDLKAVVNQIGEALVKQTRLADEMALQLRALAEATIELKTRVDAQQQQQHAGSGGGDGNGGVEVQTLLASHEEMKKTLDALGQAHAAVAAKLDAAASSSSDKSSDKSTGATQSDLSE